MSASGPIFSKSTESPASSILPLPSARQGEVLVRVERVSKKFCRNLKRSLWYGVRDMMHEFNPLRPAFSSNPSQLDLRPGEFWANRDISFEVRRGECLGLIGHNGAGKTTLLKMLNGLIKPDSGRIEMHGRVGALIALGAGFNPILTGRENIYVNGAILGLSKREIDERVDEIIDFAEIRDFIDAPVQSYSSGMQVRLGFAVATALEPDVLILDEVLAVGDAAFRAKCFRRIGKLARNCAIIFVSHDQSQTNRICTQAILLALGQPLYHGNVAEAADLYNSTRPSGSTSASTLQTDDSIETFTLQHNEASAAVQAGAPVTFKMSFLSRKRLPIGYAHLNFFDLSGTPAGQADFGSHFDVIPEGSSEVTLTIGRVDLAHGPYSLNVAIFADNRRETLVHAVNCARLQVIGKPFMWCAYKMPIDDLVVRRT